MEVLQRYSTSKNENVNGGKEECFVLPPPLESILSRWTAASSGSSIGVKFCLFETLERLRGFQTVTTVEIKTECSVRETNATFFHKGNADKLVGSTPAGNISLFPTSYFLLPCTVGPSSGSQVGIWQREKHRRLMRDGWGRALSDSSVRTHTWLFLERQLGA